MNFKKIRLYSEIQKLHRDIEQECNEKLEIIEACLESGRECPCSENMCSLREGNFLKLSQKYKELEMLLELYDNIKKSN